MTPQPLQPFRRITVSVRRADWPTWLGFTTGVVKVDGRRVAYLFGGRTRKIHVTSGEHTIGVSFAQDDLETQPLTMDEGDRIDLVCGRRQPWLSSKTFVKAALLLLGLAVVEFGIRPGAPAIRESLVSILVGLNLDATWLLNSLPSSRALVPLLSGFWTVLVLCWGREHRPSYYLTRSLSNKKKTFAGDL